MHKNREARTDTRDRQTDKLIKGFGKGSKGRGQRGGGRGGGGGGEGGREEEAEGKKLILWHTLCPHAFSEDLGVSRSHFEHPRL